MKVGDIIAPHGGCETTMKMPIGHIQEATVLKRIGMSDAGHEVIEIVVIKAYGSKAAKDTYSFYDTSSKTRGYDVNSTGFVYGRRDDAQQYFRQPKQVREGSVLRVLACRFNKLRDGNVATNNYTPVATGYSPPAMSDIMLIMALS